MGIENPRRETPRVSKEQGKIVYKPQRPVKYTTPEGIAAIIQPNEHSLRRASNEGHWSEKVNRIKQRLNYHQNDSPNIDRLKPLATGILNIGQGVHVIAKVSSRPSLQHQSYFTSGGVLFFTEGIACLESIEIPYPDNPSPKDQRRIGRQKKVAETFFSDSQNVDALVTAMLEIYLERQNE